MTLAIREAEADDLGACSVVMYEAFKDIAERHNFPPDFPNPEAAGGLLGFMMESPGFDAAVARDDGKIVGSIFVSSRSETGGISVITVDPRAQDRSVGRQLMRHGMKFLAERGHERQQLVQAAYHNRSLCLYAKLGFIAADMLSAMTGGPVTASVEDRAVRAAAREDIASCNELCRKVHGFDRAQEVESAVERGTALVVEDGGRLTGYATEVGFAGHGVGESNRDLMALIASVDAFSGPGMLVPTANGELFRWCLENGLRVVQQMVLMDTAPSGPVNGAYWPSVLC